MAKRPSVLTKFKKDQIFFINEAKKKEVALSNGVVFTFEGFNTNSKGVAQRYFVCKTQNCKGRVMFRRGEMVWLNGCEASAPHSFVT